MLLILIIYRRKSRKEAEEAFYSGWTGWYYGYDLRGGSRKTEISQDLDKEKLRDDGSLLLSPAWAETVYG